MGFNNVLDVGSAVYLFKRKDKHDFRKHAETTSTTSFPMFIFSNQENIRTYVLI